MTFPKTAKQVAIDAARQVARESGEVLKTAREQVVPSGENRTGEQGGAREKEDRGLRGEKREEKVEERKNLGFMNEYRNELEQIRKETLFKDLMKKITGGEFVALADYVNDLSFEQREVLRAQMEAVKNRREEEARERKEKETVPQIISKRARGMVGAFVRNKQLKIERKQSG